MPLEVYTDGGCPFCRWARAKIEPYDTRGALRFCDYNDPAITASTPYTLEQLGREMHVRTPDRQWHAGFFGWVAVLKVLPRWTWLGTLLGWPPLRWLGPPAYRLLAANRYRLPLPGVPKPCDPACRLETH
jgi:predicted DCC family thiol-disulfide oxidoreductase YuxK